MKGLIKITSAILLVVIALLAISCNTTAEDVSEPLLSDTFGDTESTEKDTEKKTEKSTKKPYNKKETEPPTMVEDIEGLDLNIKILSQNVRCSNDPDNNSVDERTTRFKALLDEYKPDVIGTQEVTFKWLTYLRSIEGYAVVGFSRAGRTSTSEEWSAIMYSTERFVLLDSDTFWLTETPDKVSMTKGALCRRICTWAELFDRYTGETIIMANTHLDHSNNTVRSTQTQYLLMHLRKRLGDRFNQNKVYLTGDFNCTNTSTPYLAVELVGFVDTRKAALEDRSNVKGTFHDYGQSDREIDFCFSKGEESVLSYEIISKKYMGEMDSEPGFVSDHYGVMVVFERKVVSQ